MPLYSPRYAQALARPGQLLVRAAVRIMGAGAKSNVSEWKRDLRVGAFVSAVALCFLLFRFGDFLWNLSYDLPFALRPRAAVENLAIVYMDDESHRVLGQPYFNAWNREVHARFIERLTGFGAKALVFDVLFEETNNPVADKHLVEAARGHGKVVVAAKLAPTILNDEIVTWQLSPPFPELQKAVLWGAVESSDERIFRQHYRDPGVNVQSLAWRAAEVAADTRPENPQEERWLNYYGRPGRIPWHSYHDVLNNDSLAASLSNQVVFVGARVGIGFTGGKGTDDFRTPYTWWTGLRSPGVEINATAYLNLVRHEWLQRSSAWFPTVAVIVLGLLLPMALRRLSPVRASLASAAVAAAVFGLATIVTHKFHYWFPWLVVSGVEVPCALACVLILKVQRATTEMARPARDAAVGVPAAAHAPNGTLIVAGAKPGDGLVIPDYTLVRNIGAGSFGEVWLAQNILGSYHGVKIIYRSKFEEERPFEREFEGIKHFEPISRKHHGLVHILHVGRNRERGYFFYVMELAEDANGSAAIVAETYEPRTLSAEIKKRGALPARECARLASALSEALGFLHGEGLIHRDIKPANIIYTSGQPKFADIGLVTQVGNDRTWVGTQGFFPPEGTGTLPADIYSLGKTIYCAYTGLAVDRFPDLPTSLPDMESTPVFQRLNRIILKACENDPKSRYQTAAELRHDLQEIAVEK